MPGLLFDGNKRRIYEVPGDTLGADFTYTTDAQGFRVYVPIGQGPAQITFDAQRDIWSRFQEYFDQNKWTTIALTRSGGASRGFDDQGNEIFQTNDFTLDTPNGWRLVLANYDHETIFRGNLFSGSDSISLLDYSRITAIPPPRSRVSGFDALITYAISTGGSGGNFTNSDRQDLQQTLANTNTTNTQLMTIGDDTAALARGDISVDPVANTLTLRKPDGTVLVSFDLTDENDVAKIAGAVQRTRTAQ